MVTIYCISHVPALLMLDIPGYAGQNALLLFYMLLVVQISDVLQYVFGKLFGRTKIAPVVSPSKTVEGFVGGAFGATLIGAALWWITPFTWLQAAGMANGEHGTGVEGKTSKSPDEGNENQEDASDDVEHLTKAATTQQCLEEPWRLEDAQSNRIDRPVTHMQFERAFSFDARDVVDLDRSTRHGPRSPCGMPRRLR